MKKINNMPRLLAQLFALVAFSSVVTYLVTTHLGQRKTGWVDVNKIYSEFALKKELENTLQVARISRKKILDSLELDINISTGGGGPVNQQLLQDKKQFYLQKKRVFEMEDEELRKEYQTQILKQMNQFIRDYGQKNGFQYLLGADGSGTVMYADLDLELTEKVKTYVNERYSGAHN